VDVPSCILIFVRDQVRQFLGLLLKFRHLLLCIILRRLHEVVWRTACQQRAREVERELHVRLSHLGVAVVPEAKASGAWKLAGLAVAAFNSLGGLSEDRTLHVKHHRTMVGNDNDCGRGTSRSLLFHLALERFAMIGKCHAD
jgi:hypothetical protein